MSTLFKKWWVILLQGILLIFIGILFMNKPEEVLGAISIWVAALTIINGLMGTIAYFALPASERESGMLLWSLATLAFGVLMAANLGLTARTITVFFGIWLAITGVFLLMAGWSIRKEFSFGWFVVIVGALAIFSGISILFDWQKGAVWISTLLGIQSILSGVALAILAWAKRKIVQSIVRKVQNIE